MTSVIDPDTTIRVSSVLNRDVKQFGKKFMFDGDDETCWNSDQGSPQWVQIEFNKEVELQELQIQFQGGFVGKTCWIEGCSEADGNNVMQKVCDFYPEDINPLQTFPLKSSNVSKVRIVFSDSTDFFGRITIYKLDVIGNKIS